MVVGSGEFEDFILRQCDCVRINVFANFLNRRKKKLIPGYFVLVLSAIISSSSHSIHRIGTFDVLHSS